MSESDRPTIALNVEGVNYARAWADEHRVLRGRCPMAWSTELGGYWVATRYEDILAIAQNDGLFTSGKTVDPATGAIEGGIAIPPMPIPRVVPDETDRAEWKGFRDLLNPRLGPRMAESFRARARSFADALIDRVIERGEMDLVQDLTSPLTALVTMELVGFPLVEWRAFADPLHQLVYMDKSSPEFPAAVAAMDALQQRISEAIEENRANPGDHLIGYLVQGEIDGAPIGDADLHGMIFNILSGGVDTTTALTSNALVYLWRHPDKRAALVADRSLLTAAREEFIRFFSPVHGTARTARAETRIGDQTLAPGERVMLLWAAANRDPAFFDRPDELDIGRSPNRHVGFGAGIHRCIGSFLARMMFEEMVNTMFDRLPDYDVREALARPYPTVSPINGWIDIPISFTPGPRLSAVDPDWIEGR